MVGRACTKIVRTLVHLKSPTEILRHTGKYQEEENEVKKVLQLFSTEVRRNTGSVVHGEQEVRKALQENVVEMLVLSERVERVQVTYKCSACNYEGQHTLKHPMPTNAKVLFIRKCCPRCNKTSLRITGYQDLTEDLVQMAEQSSTEMVIVTCKAEEEQMLMDAAEGIGAILRSNR
jgi:peptide subunit release factor 1 (eRF1)